MSRVKPWITLLLLLSFAPPVVAGAKQSPSLEPDTRQTIEVSSGVRARVLKEMRAMLAGLQEITLALADKEMEKVAEIAKSLGTTLSGNMPPQAMRQLPGAFRKQGLAMHQAFDRLALDAGDMGDQTQILQQLSDILGNCVACHATYRLEASADE